MRWSMRYLVDWNHLEQTQGSIPKPTYPKGSGTSSHDITMRWRFSNSSCPVRTHTHLLVFSNLASFQLRWRTSFASYSAPKVHHKLSPFHSVLKVIGATFTQSHGIPQSSNRPFYSTALRRLGHIGLRFLRRERPSDRWCR